MAGHSSNARFDEQPEATPVGIRRVLHVLLAIGRENAVTILRDLTPEELAQIAQAAKGLTTVDSAALDETTQAFEESIRDAPDFVGSSDEMLDLLDAAQSKPVLLESMPLPRPSVWDELINVDSERLCAYLIKQHPQAIAYIVSRLPARCSVEALDKFTQSQRKDIMLRLLALGPTDPQAQQWIEESIRDDLLERQVAKSNHKPLADLLNVMERPKSFELMEHLRQLRPVDAKIIRRLLFQFDDLASLPNKSLTVIAEQIAPDTLLLALSGTDAIFQAPLLAALPPRTRRMVEAEIGSGAVFNPKDIEEARRSIVGIVLAMISSGVIDAPSEPADIDSSVNPGEAVGPA